jgi:hypothetical protein
MVTQRKYDPRLIDVSFQHKQRASWKMAGRTTQGWEYIYSAKDLNFARLNSWGFSIRVPKFKQSGIVVQPIHIPNKKVWAGIDRRSVIFVKATKHPYRSMRYCKINLADPTGEKNKVGTRWGDRSSFPQWFDYFKSRMRIKNTVATTAGTDGYAQVVMVKIDDHQRMIRLYFALKVWVLEEGFVILN